jgi:predicted ATPase
VLEELRVEGFKSLGDVSISCPQLTVLFGPNAAGKSNLLESIEALSRIATLRTIPDALAHPIRGHPIEAFAFPGEGLPGLLSMGRATFTLEARIRINLDSYRYRIIVAIDPGSGSLSVDDEYLAKLARDGSPKGRAVIERVDTELHIRRKSKPAHPRQERIGLNHSVLSDARFAGSEYEALERMRNELSGWRIYYLDPRVAMRAAQPPSDVQDIGVLGDGIAPFLFKLRKEKPKHFDAIRRTLRSLIPSIEDLTVDLDKRRGTLDILIRQEGIDYSSRVVSEGTLRVLALCAIAVNPWAGSLIAFEEPENGVHPRRLELVAQLLFSLAFEQKRQVLVTTHSPLLCGMALKEAREGHKGQVELVNVKRESRQTRFDRFDATGPLFDDPEIRKGLAARNEDGLFESLLLRGIIDA